MQRYRVRAERQETTKSKSAMTSVSMDTAARRRRAVTATTVTFSPFTPWTCRAWTSRLTPRLRWSVFS